MDTSIVNSLLDILETVFFLVGIYLMAKMNLSLWERTHEEQRDNAREHRDALKEVVKSLDRTVSYLDAVVKALSDK